MYFRNYIYAWDLVCSKPKVQALYKFSNFWPDIYFQYFNFMKISKYIYHRQYEKQRVCFKLVSTIRKISDLVQRKMAPKS